MDFTKLLEKDKYKSFISKKHNLYLYKNKYVTSRSSYYNYGSTVINTTFEFTSGFYSFIFNNEVYPTKLSLTENFYTLVNNEIHYPIEMRNFGEAIILATRDLNIEFQNNLTIIHGIWDYGGNGLIYQDLINF